VLIKDQGLQNSVVVSGGVASVGLSLLTLNPAGKKVRMTHYINLLGDIWYQPKKSTIYSAQLWFILTSKKLSNNQMYSKVENIKMRWLKFELNNSIDRSTETLLFGQGGLYTEDNLNLRTAMLNEVQAAVQSVNEDLLSILATTRKFEGK